MVIISLSYRTYILIDRVWQRYVWWRLRWNMWTLSWRTPVFQYRWYMLNWMQCCLSRGNVQCRWINWFNITKIKFGQMKPICSKWTFAIGFQTFFCFDPCVNFNLFHIFFVLRQRYKTFSFNFQIVTKVCMVMNATKHVDTVMKIDVLRSTEHV